MIDGIAPSEYEEGQTLKPSVATAHLEALLWQCLNLMTDDDFGVGDVDDEDDDEQERESGETKYYLTNHPDRTPLRVLATAIKANWSCEQAHQQLKEELGFDHFEGRTWLGLHHHALMTLISFAFLQHLRLREITRGRGREKNRPVTPPAAPRRAAAALAAGGPSRAAHPRQRRAPAMPAMQRATDLPAARVNIDVAR